MSGSTNLGVYTYGEKPPALLVTFTDADGNAINLTGYSVVGVYKIKGQSPDDSSTEFSASLSDATNGVVSLPWGSTASPPFSVAAARATPSYTVELQAWAGNGSVLYASEKFRFAVVEATGDDTPAI